MARKSNKKLFWVFVLASVWLLSLVGLFWTNFMRASGGIETYYSDPFLMTLGSASSIVFSATTLGVVLTFVVNKAIKALKK